MAYIFVSNFILALPSEGGEGIVGLISIFANMVK
jgi:hypothetical protein